MDAPVVIYESPDFLIINKPAGLQVHAARVKGEKKEETRETLVDWLVEYFPEIKKVGDDPELRPGIVHRLDKDTSGIMVVAKTQAAFEYFKALFQKHEMEKTYVALVQGVPKEREGVIDAPIGIRNGTLKRSVHSEKMAKPAVTEYKTVRTFKGASAAGEKATFSLIEARPRTGRTHQIRVHLASIGHPLIGDGMYGPKKQPTWARRLMLHALSLEFTGPEGRRAKFEAEPPEEFEEAIRSLEAEK